MSLYRCPTAGTASGFETLLLRERAKMLHKVKNQCAAQTPRRASAEPSLKARGALLPGTGILHLGALQTPGHGSLSSLRGARQASFLAQKMMGEIHRNAGAKSGSPLIAKHPTSVSNFLHAFDSIDGLETAQGQKGQQRCLLQ